MSWVVVLVSGCLSGPGFDRTRLGERSARVIVVAPGESLYRQMRGASVRGIYRLEPEGLLRDLLYRVPGNEFSRVREAGMVGLGLLNASILTVTSGPALPAMHLSTVAAEDAAQAESTARVEAQRELAAGVDLELALSEQVEAHWLSPAGPGIDRVARAGEFGDGDAASLDEVLAETDQDLAVFLAAVPQLTPGLEILEMRGVFAIFEVSEDGPHELRYANDLIYQSTQHGLPPEPDSIHRIERYLDELRESLLDERRRFRSGSRLPAMVRHEVEEQVERRRRTLMTRYRMIEEGDPEGEVWLRNEGELLIGALEEGIAEIVRLGLLELQGRCAPGSSEPRRLPGSGVEMEPCDEGAAGERLVFRDRDGSLISVHARSRFLPRDT